MNHLHRDTEAEFFTDAASLTGTAVYEIITERDFSRDVGGEDGTVVISVELQHVSLSGLKLDRYQMIQMMGEAAIQHAEAVTGDEWSERIYELEEVA